MVALQSMVISKLPCKLLFSNYRINGFTKNHISTAARKVTFSYYPFPETAINENCILKQINLRTASVSRYRCRQRCRAFEDCQSSVAVTSCSSAQKCYQHHSKLAPWFRSGHMLLESNFKMALNADGARRWMCTGNATNSQQVTKSPPLKTAFVNSHNASFNVIYADIGNPAGPVILCLPGIPGSHKDFTEIVEGLLPTGARILVLNYPGYGYTTLPEDSVYNFSVHHKVDFTKNFLETIGINKVAVVVSHSFASSICNYLCAREEFVKSWVSIAGIGIKPHALVRPFWLLKTLAWLLSNQYTKDLLTIVLSPVIIKVSGFRVPDASYVIKSIYSVATLDFHQIKENWQRIMVEQVPVSLFCGSADNYIEYARQKELFKYLNLPDECLCEIDARGHVINGSLELKQRLNAFVIKDGKHWIQKSHQKVITDVIINMLNYVHKQ